MAQRTGEVDVTSGHAVFHQPPPPPQTSCLGPGAIKVAPLLLAWTMQDSDWGAPGPPRNAGGPETKLTWCVFPYGEVFLNPFSSCPLTPRLGVLSLLYDSISIDRIGYHYDGLQRDVLAAQDKMRLERRRPGVSSVHSPGPRLPTPRIRAAPKRESAGLLYRLGIVGAGVQFGRREIAAAKGGSGPGRRGFVSSSDIYRDSSDFFQLTQLDRHAQQ